MAGCVPRDQRAAVCNKTGLCAPVVCTSCTPHERDVVHWLQRAFWEDHCDGENDRERFGARSRLAGLHGLPAFDC